MTKRVTLPIGILAALLAAPAASAEPVTQKAASVIVTRASSICFSSLVRTTGTLAPRSPVAVMFALPGYRVTEVSAQDGDRVTEGQQLAVLSKDASPDPQAAGQPQGASQVQGAATIVVRAPVAGLVMGGAAKVGQPAPKQQPLFTLAGGGEIETVADIPSIHVLELNPGQTARISLDDGREFGGHVRLVPPEIDRVRQVGQARISVENEPTLKAGTFAHVVIDANRSCGVAVPRGALTQSSNGISVQVVKDQTVATRTVRLGLLSDTDAEISEGVAEGDLVVANAGTSLRNGDKVIPIDTDLQEVR